MNQDYGQGHYYYEDDEPYYQEEEDDCCGEDDCQEAQAEMQEALGNIHDASTFMRNLPPCTQNEN